MSRNKLIAAGLVCITCAVLYGVYIRSVQEDIVTSEAELRLFILSETDQEIQKSLFLPILELRSRRNVLRLQRYALEARINPLYALPGVDLVNYARALELLGESEEEIVTILRANGKNNLEHLYPLAFLSSLGELESVRRELVSHPSKHAAETYHALLLDTIDAYSHSIDQLLDGMRSATSTNIQIRFHTGYSSPGYLIQTLENYKKMALTQKDRAKKRYMCFEGDKNVCEHLALPAAGPPSSDEIFGSIPDEVQERYTVIDRLRTEGPYGGENGTIKQVTLSESSCVYDFVPTHYYLWWRYGPKGERIFRPDIVNELLFLDASGEDMASTEYGKLFWSLTNATYHYQPIAQSYSCPDIALDFTNLERQLYIYDRVLKNKFEVSKLEITEELKDALQDIRLMQERIVSKTTLSEAESYRYVETLTELIDRFGENKVAEAIGEDAVLEFESQILTYVTRTHGFEEVLLGVYGNNQFIREFTTYSPVDSLGSVWESIFVRTAPFTMFGGANPSIAPISLSFVEVPADELALFHLRTLEEAQGTRSLEEFIDMLKETQLVEKQMGEMGGLEYPDTPGTHQY